jgi:hypothetical protein
VTKTTPLLFVTGTCANSVVNSVQRIVGITFDASNNAFWPAAEEMKHRQVFMEVACTTQVFSLFKKRLAPRLKAGAVEKLMPCSNTRAAVERVAPKLCDWIDLEGCKSDALKIVESRLKFGASESQSRPGASLVADLTSNVGAPASLLGSGVTEAAFRTFISAIRCNFPNYTFVCLTCVRASKELTAFLTDWLELATGRRPRAKSSSEALTNP